MASIREVLTIDARTVDDAIRLQRDYGSYIYDELQLKEMQDKYYHTLKDFPGEMFTRPLGTFFVAYNDNNEALGIIGIRKFADGIWEMKRFYLDPKFRGAGFGKQLVSKIINVAKEFGYSKMYLDTDPRMPAAIKIYKQFGFVEVPPYYDSLNTDGVYMELDLCI